MKGSDKITLKLNTITFGGMVYEVTTAYVETKGQGEGKRTARKVGGGAGLGAIVGGIAGGGEGAAIGAAIGGVTGAAVAVRRRRAPEAAGRDAAAVPAQRRGQRQDVTVTTPSAGRAPAWPFASPAWSAGARAGPPRRLLRESASRRSRARRGCGPSGRRPACRSGFRRHHEATGNPTVSRGPVARIIARSTTFRSSRMLPGQWIAAAARPCSRRIVDPLAERFRLLLDEPPHEAGMSSTRSRSGGMRMGNTLSR